MRATVPSPFFAPDGCREAPWGAEWELLQTRRSSYAASHVLGPVECSTLCCGAAGHGFLVWVACCIANGCVSAGTGAGTDPITDLMVVPE